MKDFMNYRRAAGLEVKLGRPRKAERPSKEDLLRLYVEEGRSVREISGILGHSKDMVFRCVKEYGLKRQKATGKRS